MHRCVRQLDGHTITYSAFNIALQQSVGFGEKYAIAVSKKRSKGLHTRRCFRKFDVASNVPLNNFSVVQSVHLAFTLPFSVLLTTLKHFPSSIGGRRTSNFSVSFIKLSSILGHAAQQRNNNKEEEKEIVL